jgi:hypothetical protein
VISRGGRRNKGATGQRVAAIKSRSRRLVRAMIVGVYSCGKAVGPAPG